MIQQVQGDLFKLPFEAIAHGCNCTGKMGSGIAVDFRSRYPAMFAVYAQRCKEGRFALGDCMIWTEPSITIFNLGTQPVPGPTAKIDAIVKAVTRMVLVAEHLGIRSIGLPRIGCGLGGLKWPQVWNAMNDTALVRLSFVELTFVDFAPSSELVLPGDFTLSKP